MKNFSAFNKKILISEKMFSGIRITFDGEDGKYVAEKLSPTEHLLEIQKLFNPGLMDTVFGF